MKVIGVKLRNFLGFSDPGVSLTDFGPREVIVGSNGTGKSSILHSLEFVGRAFKNQILDGRQYVHRSDYSKPITVELEIALEAEELTALATLLTYGVTLQQSQMNPAWRVGQQQLNQLLRAVLSSDPRFFDSWLASHKIVLRVVSVPGVQQTLVCSVEFRGSVGSVFLTRQGVITSRGSELTGWGGFDLEQEILAETASRVEGVFANDPVDFTRASDEITTTVRGWSIERFDSRIQHAGPLPIALRLDQVPTFVDTQLTSGGDSALIQVRGLLTSRGYSSQSIDLFGAISHFFNTSFAALGSTRGKPQKISIQAVGVPSEYNPIFSAESLPLTLFFFKNHWDLGIRKAYGELQEAFRALTGLGFDVTLNPELEQPPPDADRTSSLQVDLTAGSPATPGQGSLFHYPYIVFNESGFPFLAEFGAAGFLEVLLVLTTVLASTRSVVLLDEPVLNLHPSKQRELYSRLTGAAHDRGSQLFIVTHSNSLVAPDDLVRAVRFDKNSGAPTARRLQPLNSREAAQTVKELERVPRLTDALFARAVILVEGGAEASGLPVWFEKCSGGDLLAKSGVIVIDVGGDTHFGAIARILTGWGIPFRVLADSGAQTRIERFGAQARTYPFNDYSDLLRHYFSELLPLVVREVGGSGGDKDPAVARIIALRSEPPLAVTDLWEWLRPFLAQAR